MCKRHNFSISEIEAMLPWERDAYISLIIQDLKKQEENAKRRLNA